MFKIRSIARLVMMAAMLMLMPATAMAQGGAPMTMPPVPAPASSVDDAAKAISLSDGYVLGAGDVVEVSVLGRDEFKPRVQVQADGTIQLPFLGTVTAANRTVLQLREDVKNALKAGGYYANPVVNVAVATYASRYVIVLGQVGTPGIVPIDRAYRVSEILARAGGARETGADTLSLRRATGEEIELVIRDIATGGPEQDPFVNPGDKIYIAAAKTFYIYGQVTAPGTYRIDPDMTLRKALARGGGLTSMGSEKRVKVIRDGKEITKFDPSNPIVGGDVIVVGERFF